VEARFPHRAPPPIIPGAGALAHDDTEDEFDDDKVDAQQRRRLLRHCQGMGGNGRRRPHAPKQDNNPYAKIKFSIPPFYGSYDAKTYLDWEMMVEKNLAPILFLSVIELDKPLVSLKILLSFGGMNLLMHVMPHRHGLR
jgi:hypothetical protein